METREYFASKNSNVQKENGKKQVSQKAKLKVIIEIEKESTNRNNALNYCKSKESKRL